MIRRTSATFMLLFLIVFCLAACDKKEPVQVGFIGGLSGRVADLGVGGRNGVMLAIEQRNAIGGIKGRGIELIVRDDEQRADIAREKIAELIDQKVAAIIGPMTSSMAMAMVPLVNAAKIVMVSPTVTTSELSNIDDYFFRVIADTTGYAGKNARYQFETLGQRRAVVIYDLGNRSYTESWLKDFRVEFEGLGGELVDVKTFISGKDLSFQERVAALLEARPDFVLILANAIDAAQICQQVRKLNPRMPIVMSEWASTERFIELAGRAAEEVYVSQFINRNDSSARYQEFYRAFIERFGQAPGFAGLAGYDAALAVLDGLARQTSGESLKESLLSMGEVLGVQQTIHFGRFGDADRKTFVTVIRNGSYVTLE